MIKITQLGLPQVFKESTDIISAKFYEGLVKASPIFKVFADFQIYHKEKLPFKALTLKSH